MAFPEEGGTVSGAGIYSHGDTCTLIAKANPGYTFINWTMEDEEISTDTTFSFTVAESSSYYAHFDINSYTVTAMAFPEEGGTVSGAGIYSFGDTCTLIATANPSYTFMNWTEDGVVVSTLPTYQFVVDDNRTLQANFSDTAYTVTAVVYPLDGGTIEGVGVYEYGTMVTLTAHANDGYMFFCWYEDDTLLSFNPSVSLEVTENHVVYALFVENGTVAQTTTLSAGWNWWSTNVDIVLDDLKSALVEALPGTYITIKSNNNGQTSWNGRLWNGQLKTLDVSQMYKIKVSVECEITTEGMPLDPVEHPVTIRNGASWIGYPFGESMTIAKAFAGFAVNGDAVKSASDGQASWNGRMWMGTLKDLEPVKGYIYKSNAMVNRTFIFSRDTK